MKSSISARSMHSHKGFTLIEIMLVIGIITVLMGAAIFLMTGNVDFAKVQRARTDLQSIATQLKLYEIQNYSPPTTEQGLDALVNKPRTEPVPARIVYPTIRIPSRYTSCRKFT